MNDVTESQIEMMKHAIGWDFVKPKHKILNAYRNRYFTNKNDKRYLEWKDLENKKFAKENSFIYTQSSLFQVTTKAIKFLSSKYKVKIIQDKEDIVEG